MLINSTKEISEITKISHIKYAHSFLRNQSIGLELEINNKQVFCIIKRQLINDLKVTIEPRATSFIDENPKEWFNSLMDMAWAAS